MMRTLVAFFLLCNAVCAQINVDVSSAYVLTGNAEQLGDLIVVNPQDEEITLTSAGIVKVSVPNATENAQVSIDFIDKNWATPEYVKRPDKWTAVVLDPGMWRVEIMVVQESPFLFRRAIKTVEVKKGGISPGGGDEVEIPEPSSSLQQLVQPIADKLSTDPDKAKKVSVMFMGFADAVSGKSGQRIASVGIYSAIMTDALRDLDASDGVRIGAEVDRAVGTYLGVDKNSEGWQDKSFSPEDRTKLAEVFRAIAWAGVQ